MAAREVGVDEAVAVRLCDLGDGEHELERVAETVRADNPAGRALLVGGRARTLRTAVQTDIRRVQLDGHVTDPHLHLHPLLLNLPWSGSDPPLLVELAIA